MKKRYYKPLAGGFAAALTTGLLALPAAHAATITQTVNDGGTGWNSALWGPPTAAAPTSGNDYVTASGLAASAPTQLGASVTGRVRAITGQETFAGDSLEIVSNTELLIKNSGTYTANIILNGGIVRLSPNTAANATLAGTINVAANSVLGSVQFATQAFTISSTVTGSSTLRLAGGTANNQTITFDDGVGTSLNGFAGTIDIGGGQTNAGGANRVTVDFNQAYNMTLAGILMGGYSTADILNLDASISVASFTFGGSPTLVADTYTTSELNALYGNGSQFTGSGTLTVIPEPAAALLGGLGLLGLLRRRRA